MEPNNIQSRYDCSQKIQEFMKSNEIFSERMHQRIIKSRCINKLRDILLNSFLKIKHIHM